ncbi:MAG: DUF1700 domain-containing protein [Clostridia bacterium]|nr:DUF1700 domain-containing protein [Clostridia bacterium]
MTYNEWRDELKCNLLCVPEQERARVLDYYAEAYADRRDAGYAEQEITAEFGAPYDAAQRILSESGEQYFIDNTLEMGEDQSDDLKSKSNPTFDCNKQNVAQKSSEHTWVFVLLCVIFAIPIFGILMAMVCVTIGFSVTPFALLIAGVATIGAGVGELFADAVSGVVAIGAGLVLFGISLIIMPLFLKLVKLMWKLFIKFFAWLKSLFNVKEKI